MTLSVNPYKDVDLSKIDGVKEAICNVIGGKILIHLFCESGKEQLVFDSLPAWIHSKVNVTKGYMQVILENIKVAE